MNAWEDLIRLATDLLRYLMDSQAQSLVAKTQDQIMACEQSAKKVLSRFGFFACALILLLSGLGFIIYGTFVLLAAQIGSGQAALIIGIIISVVSVLLAVLIHFAK